MEGGKVIIYTIIHIKRVNLNIKRNRDKTHRCVRPSNSNRVKEHEYIAVSYARSQRDSSNIM